MSKTYTIRSTDLTTAVVVPVSTRYNQWTASIVYYDAAFASVVVPTAGTVAVVGQSAPAEFSSTFNQSPLDGTVPASFVSLAAKLNEITLTGTGLTGNSVDVYEVTLIGTD